jgi:flagellar protein FlgJ
MSGVGGIGGAPKPDSREQVRQLAHQLEGVFLNQLFQAMRASVPQDGELGSAPGQEMFTQMFDERVAAEAANHMSRGLGDALYRQLAARLPAPGPTEAK